MLHFVMNFVEFFLWALVGSVMADFIGKKKFRIVTNMTIAACVAFFITIIFSMSK